MVDSMRYRVAEVILAAKEEMDLREIAAILAVPVPRVSQALFTLWADGFLVRSGVSGHYLYSSTGVLPSRDGRRDRPERQPFTKLTKQEQPAQIHASPLAQALAWTP